MLAEAVTLKKKFKTKIAPEPQDQKGLAINLVMSGLRYCSNINWTVISFEFSEFPKTSLPLNEIFENFAGNCFDMIFLACLQTCCKHPYEIILYSLLLSNSVSSQFQTVVS